MSFSKEFSLPGGKLSVSASGAAVAVEISASAELGGGEAQGVLQVEGSGKVSISPKQAIDLAFGMIEAHLPAAAALIAKEVQAFADAEIGSL